ncbi:hypothetical protein GLOTRDRAFT_70814 [Gloeophyllum trabeum ATCC 11539]|uniref:BRCT domain-containing protein n=1 Tax=Gloeophyllum trabeum (strain ATCC 11539 / FP-39264 / Madison 617) TaxID=670483 RepID=S7S0Z6_GLOTA|nr:uncharacterized protein GLOTRDRAFT_70814 [Gloeophyllum trabeum ATCC 11539]EPQ59404.1 hypothetical protein GLOTRDRAFT_70814 [Gloeophyllum trabeum ATCC 11539]
MDKFVTVKKSATRQTTNTDKGKTRPSFRYQPYAVSQSEERTYERWKADKRTEKILARLTGSKDSDQPTPKPSTSALTKQLLNTLGDESNPITHSDIRHRSDYITSAATGHQRGEGGRGRGEYLKSRGKKLEEQNAPVENAPCKPMTNVRIYIDGYLADTTDIEMKRIVVEAGGRAMQTASGCTHILTSQQLSGSKTHKLLTAKARNKVHVVKPEWVTDSIKAGKRLPERNYAVVMDRTMPSLEDMFARQKD